jgi:cytochrome c
MRERWIVALVFFAAACGGSAPEPKAASAAETPEAQVAMGEKLYVAKCADCHGGGGQGDKDSPPVVGKRALPLDPPSSAKARKTKFVTAQDVAAFVKHAMPADAPGTLSDEEAYAILAFDLKANGVPITAKIDPASAIQIRLH